MLGKSVVSLTQYKSLGSVFFLKDAFESHQAHQGSIYLIKKTINYKLIVFYLNTFFKCNLFL